MVNLTEELQSEEYIDIPIPSVPEIIHNYAEEGVIVRQKYFATYSQDIEKAAYLIALTITNGGKILLCGNGGSAADAQHIAGIFVNRFLIDRPPLPAIALNTDTSILTAIDNDFTFEQVFSKQVQAIGQKGDLLIGISTSGTSTNILSALNTAKLCGLHTIGLTGLNKSLTNDLESSKHINTGQIVDLCDILLSVPHTSTPVIQEIHIATGHILCQLVDYFLFENTNALILSQYKK